MTGKAKAIQVMTALSFTAIAYTVYNAASNKETKAKAASVQVQRVVKSTKKENQAKASNAEVKKADERNQYQVPGYSNPDESSR